MIDFDAHAERIGPRSATSILERRDRAGASAARSSPVLERLERDYEIVPSKNSGSRGTTRSGIYNLLAHGKLYEGIPVHQNVLPVVEGVLDPGCLVSSLSSIAIDPGETRAADPRRRPADPAREAARRRPVCNTMWALTDFTEENGATRIIPGSHLRDHSPAYGSSTYDSIAAEMPAGSVPRLARQPVARRRREPHRRGAASASR